MSLVPFDTLDADAIGRRCLVTGGAGYLGRHLVDALHTLGCEVAVLDVVRPGRDDVESFVGDIRDAELVRRAVKGRDTVFHTAAAMSFVRWAPRAVEERVRSINVGGTAHVVAACQAEGVGKLVHTSSANVVIDREMVEVGEEMPLPAVFEELYGETKAAGETEVLTADAEGSLRTVALRPGGIWGGGNGGFMVRAFLEQVAQGRFVATIGDGAAVVDNTHIDTLVWAELLAAQALTTKPEIVGGRPYFITDDERINGIRWFKPITDGLGLPWPTARLPGWLAYAVATVGEAAHKLGAPEPTLTRIGVLKLIRSSAFCVDAARRDLGWEPLVKSEEGLARYLDDYRATLEAMRG